MLDNSGIIKKIAFVGSHGVGKTTLLNDLKEALKLGENNLVEETATKVFEMGKDNPALRINQGATLEAQLHIIGLQLEDEVDKKKAMVMSKENEKPLLVCDRSSLDAVVYTYHRICSRPGYEWGKELPLHLLNWVVDKTKVPYDYIFYLPIEFELETSDVRPGDIEFQERIDELMQGLFIGSRLGSTPVDISPICKNLVIVSGSRERRVKTVSKYLR